MRSRAFSTSLLGTVLLLASVGPVRAQLATGTYTGDGTVGRTITGLGFQPDVVILKADHVTSGVARTSTMAGGTKELWATNALQANMITSLDADGFTVGSHLHVNGLNVCGAGSDPCQYYWTALKADANIVVGTYVGDGNATQAITGIGFSVDYVMIFGDGNRWARNRTRFSSTTLLGAGANFRIRNAGENSTSIPSLDADGFTVGDGATGQEDANESGVTYHYVAFNENPGQIKVGMYTGDGTNPRDITGVGFQPAYVLVQSLDDGDEAYQKSDQMAASVSSNFRDGLITNRIVGLISDGFQVSNDARVNDSSGEDYSYVAFAAGGGAASLTQGHYRWRNDDGPEGSGTPPTQVTATADDSTTSTTDVVVSGMTMTPGAGDYVVWFSSSVENSAGTDDQFVSLYLDGTQLAHTERQATVDSSIPGSPFPVATHAFLSGVTAGQAIDVRWRTTGGTATMHERTLVAAPVNPADVTEVSATADDTTVSATDVTVAGMSITPGAGDYLVWFSGSVSGDTADTNQYVSIYDNGAQVAHSERQSFNESSIAGTSFPVATHAFLAGVGAAETIDIRWRTDGGTATMHERTLVVAKVSAADIFQASDTVDAVTASTTDVVVPSLTLTPGSGDYLAWFSGSIEGDTDDTSQFASLYDNGAQVGHSQRGIFTENSIPSTSFPIASHAYVPRVGAAEDVDVRFRTSAGNATMHERTLVLQKLASTAGATWAAAEDTKLMDLTKGTTKRIRFGVSNEGIGGSGTVTYELQVAETATCSAGTYTTVPTTSTDHWQIVDSSFITDGEATNNSPDLTDDASTFVAGELKDAGNTTGAITLASDELTEIEFAVQATTNATDGGDYCFRLYDATNNQVLDSYTVYAEVQLVIPGGTLTLADHDVGQVPDRFTSAASVSDVLYQFKLSQTPPVTITDIRVQYTTGSGVVDADVTAGALYRDENDDGVVDGGDTLLASGVAGSAGMLAFTGLSEDPGTGTNYLVVADVANLVPGDTTTFSLTGADIDEVEFGVAEGGSISDAVHTANAAAKIYYSVGISTADFKNGTPTVTISSGTATFTTPQPANVGVGDEITYNGGTKAYISGRTSAYIYTVTTATGLVPPDITDATVDSITRAFNSLKVAATDALDASHLNTSDLVAADAQLNLACYNDGPDPSKYVRIEEPWVTGPTNYIRVFTPVSADEVGISQRHLGVAGTGYRIAPTGAAGIDYFNFILVSNDFGYVRIEGLEIDGSGLTDGENVRGLMSNDTDGPLQDVRFTDNLIHDITNTTIEDGDQSRVLGIFLDNTDDSKVANNIIYNLTSVSTNAQGQARGIESDDPGTTHYVYNNTLHNIRSTATTGTSRGIYDAPGSTIFARNNFVGLVDSALGSELCFSTTFAAENNNVSSDGTATGPGSQTGQSDYASYFVNVSAGSENFHLLSDSSTLWGTTGADLDGDPNLPVTDDIDGEPRHPSTPDIGADEATVTTNYRSIGTAPNYTTGTIDATAGSAVVDGVGTSWITANRGRGDHIAFNGEEYTIFSVDSETQLTLTEPVVTTFAGAYTISRQFTLLQDWADCIANAGGCTFFPPASSSLVADDRAEVGIAYNDSTFTAELDIDNATTDASHTITLTADGDNRHYGISGAGVVIDCTGCTADSVIVNLDYVTIEWLELQNNMTDSANAGIKVRPSENVLLQFILSHDNWNGIRQSGSAGKSLTIRNSIVYNNTDIGIEADEPGDVMIVENCTVFGNGSRGVWGALSGSTTTVRNTISMNNPAGTDIDTVGTQENNISSDGTASCGSCLPNRDFTANASPGAPPQGNGWVMFLNLNPGNEDFHLRNDPAQNDAQDNAQDLSASFTRDIDLDVRATPWDVGADDADGTTAVELVSLEAAGVDGAVELSWETGSEIANLGFHLYRSTAPDSGYERITEEVIPGLGSSPSGARYRYRDEGLTNGVTYYYELEDIETSGATEFHGPVSAVPRADALTVFPDEGDAEKEEPVAQSLVTFGDPSANRFEVLSWDERGAVVELRTEGFYAEPVEDGAVAITAPGLEPLGDTLAIPVGRPWIEAVVGVGAKIVGIESSGVEVFTSLRPLDAEAFRVVSTRDGVVRRERRRGGIRRGGWIPRRPAGIVGTTFQDETQKVQLELAPLRWNPRRSELRLTRRLVVRVAFAGRSPDEFTGRGRYRRREARNVVARFATTNSGLHGVRYDQVFGSNRRTYDVETLRLSRLGQTTPFHVEPDRLTFGPQSTLYFVSAGPDANPYGWEAVYELAWDDLGEPKTMPTASAAPAGEDVPYFWETLVEEHDRYYQPALLTAPDRWLGDVLMSRNEKSYPVEIDAVATTVETARLSVWLQGASDLEASPDHHVRVRVNGMLVGNGHWDGKAPYRIDGELPPGALVAGTNTVQIENVGDTDAAYSMVFLDRFELDYPRPVTSASGRLEGSFSQSGAATIRGIPAGARVLDVSEPSAPAWLEELGASSGGDVRFRVERSRRYLVVSPDSIRIPEVRRPAPPRLQERRRGGEYLVIGPESFLDVARPLMDLRSSEGLRVLPVSIEQIFDELGYGEPRPEAIRDFLELAYHEWEAPKPRYVLLLGDATYDFKDLMGTGVVNRVPPLMVETSFLWTASDPTFAMIDGGDLVPDIAIGRLPAKDVDELESMITKILEFEHGDARFRGTPVVLVADDADVAGDFEADADEIAASVLSREQVEKIYLSELGPSATRAAIVRSFDDGAGLVSYMGHGGIHLWADENIFNLRDVAGLASQPQQPLFITMNCLNGYFHFPFFDSLAEGLLEAEGRGAIAAFSPTGLSLNTPAHRYHKALLDALTREGPRRLGDAVLEAQKHYAESGAFPELLAIYHLLGDPALRLK